MPAAPRYRLIALDLDGTTLAPDGRTVRPRTLAAIDALRTAGVAVTFATGRSYTESRTVLDDLGHDGPGVFANGAMVSRHPSGETAVRSHVPPDAAADACRVLLDLGLVPAVLQDPTHTDADYLVPADPPTEASRRDWWHSMGAVVREVADLTDPAVHGDTLRINTLGPTPEIKQAAAAVKAARPGALYLHEITVKFLDQTLLEVFDARVNKWHGVSRIADELGVSAGQVVAVGDDYNDWHMIEHAGLGVAMADAPAEVRALADRVIGSNADEALADFLEFLLTP